MGSNRHTGPEAQRYDFLRRRCLDVVKRDPELSTEPEALAERFGVDEDVVRRWLRGE